MIEDRFYRATVDIKDGTAEGATVKIGHYSTLDGNVFEEEFITKNTFETKIHNFECSDSINHQIKIQMVSDLGGNNIEVKNFRFYEIDPDGRYADGSILAGSERDTTDY